MAIKIMDYLKENGDSIVSFYKSGPSKYGSSALITLDLSTKYIRNKKQPKSFKNLTNSNKAVKVFDFTNNRYRYVKSRSISYISPLSRVLNNDKILN